MEPVIELSGVSKRFLVGINRSPSLKSKFIGIFRPRYRDDVREFWALRDVDLRVHPGDSVGIIGPNGSGKSTLFRLIAGILRPTHGSLHTRGRIAPMIELGVGFHTELTGLENIFLSTSYYGITRKETERLVDDIVGFSELGDFIETPLKNYSSGMVMRLGFAVAIHTLPDILLVDEILAVGDKRFQAKCLARMTEFSRRGRTFVLISHDLGQVARMCARTILLWNGRVLAEGPSDEIVERYSEMTSERAAERRFELPLDVQPQGR
ncbi:MAG: ABC transporter ATP-binding protein [Planctomycetota bacterium]|jgi:ABC-type polysaccharide/polyol phosphate transport system ATPase subunit